MKKRFTEEQVIRILREAESPGVQIREVLTCPQELAAGGCSRPRFTDSLYRPSDFRYSAPRNTRAPPGWQGQVQDS